MTETQATALEEVIENLRSVLAKCDEAGVAAVPAIYADLAMNLAMRERDSKVVEAV